MTVFAGKKPRTVWNERKINIKKTTLLKTVLVFKLIVDSEPFPCAQTGVDTGAKKGRNILFRPL